MVYWLYCSEKYLYVGWCYSCGVINYFLESLSPDLFLDLKFTRRSFLWEVINDVEEMNSRQGYCYIMDLLIYFSIWIKHLLHFTTSILYILKGFILLFLLCIIVSFLKVLIISNCMHVQASDHNPLDKIIFPKNSWKIMTNYYNRK